MWQKTHLTEIPLAAAILKIMFELSTATKEFILKDIECRNQVIHFQASETLCGEKNQNIKMYTYVAARR